MARILNSIAALARRFKLPATKTSPVVGVILNRSNAVSETVHCRPCPVAAAFSTDVPMGEFSGIIAVYSGCEQTGGGRQVLQTWPLLLDGGGPPYPPPAGPGGMTAIVGEGVGGCWPPYPLPDPGGMKAMGTEGLLELELVMRGGWALAKGVNGYGPSWNPVGGGGRLTCRAETRGWSSVSFLLPAGKANAGNVT